MMRVHTGHACPGEQLHERVGAVEAKGSSTVGDKGHSDTVGLALLVVAQAAQQRQTRPLSKASP